MRRRVTQILENGLNAQQWSLHHCKVSHKIMWKLLDKLSFLALFGFFYTNLAVWVQRSIQKDWNRSLSLKINKNEAISFIFFYLVALCLKLIDEIMCFTASLNLNVKYCQEYRQKCGQKVETTGSTRFQNTLWKKTARMAPPNTLTDPYVRFSLKAQPYLTFMTRTPKSRPYNITLPKYNVLIQRWVLDAFLIFCWSTP